MSSKLTGKPGVNGERASKIHGLQPCHLLQLSRQDAVRSDVVFHDTPEEWVVGVCGVRLEETGGGCR
jgi:hypothetical protein